MRHAAAVLTVLFATMTAAHASPVVSLGVGVSTPEIFGVYVSFWPSENLTLDARATLATLDGGVTGHIPVASDGSWRHSVLVHALAGWAGLPYHLPYNGPRLAGLVGYGLLGVVDLRLEAGVTAQPLMSGVWGSGFTALAMIGYPL